MHIVTKKALAAGVAGQWLSDYYQDGQWQDTMLGPSEEKYVQLLALGESITAEQVDAIIGNSSWTRNICDECELDVETTVHFGDDPDYDALWVNLCPECLRKGMELMDRRKQ